MTIEEIEEIVVESVIDMVGQFRNMPPDLRVIMLKFLSRQLATVCEFGAALDMRETAR